MFDTGSSLTALQSSPVKAAGWWSTVWEVRRIRCRTGPQDNSQNLAVKLELVKLIEKLGG